MASSHQTFVEAACDDHPAAAKYDPRDPPATWVDALTARPWNWMPAAALEKMRADPQPRTAVDVTLALMRNALDYAREEAPDVALPENPMAPEYVTGTLARFQTRLVAGHVAELTAAAYLESAGFELVPVTEKYDSATKAEQDDVDLLAADGTTVQVKAFETNADERKKMNADLLVEVIDGEPRRRWL
jgi:hypothetical protein